MSDWQVITTDCMPNLPLQIASAGFRAILTTGVQALAGDAIDAIQGVLSDGFGTGTVQVAQGNQWREPIFDDNRYCWNWPYPAELSSTDSPLYLAQVSTGLRTPGDLKCYLSPYISVLPDLPNYPTAAGWQSWLAVHQNPRHPDAITSLNVRFHGPFVIAWRVGMLYALVVGVVDYTGAFKYLTLGQAKHCAAAHPPGSMLVHGQNEIVAAIEAWENALSGRASDIPPEILNLLLQAAPPGEEPPREYWRETIQERKSRLPLIAAAIAAALAWM